jgi:hypothetical protein
MINFQQKYLFILILKEKLEVRLTGGVARFSCSCPMTLFYTTIVKHVGFAPTTLVITGVIMIAIIIPVTN